MKRSTLFVLASSLALSGCVVGKDYKAPETDLPEKYSEARKIDAPAVTQQAWWTAFRDKKLDSLVDQGMQQNLGVMAALERINEAQASAVAAGASGLPSINGVVSHTVSGRDLSSAIPGPGQVIRTRKTTNGTVQASWVLDLFGQYARTREAAGAQLDAAYADVGVARLAFYSDLVSSYVEMRYYQAALSQTRRNLESRRETLRLINEIKEAGDVSRLDVVQAEGLVNQAIAELPGLEAAFHQSANHIATLLGVPAATITKDLMRGAGQPVPRYNPKVGVPADLIRNRPDIRRAERLLAASVAQIGVAEAQLYPSLSLSGDINITKVVASGAATTIPSWNFGPTLSIPIFNGGALKAQVKIAKSAAEQQYIAWKQTVLNAVEEVESAQIALNRGYQTVAATRRLVSSYESSLQLARESYRSGASTILDVLDAERNVASGRLALAGALRQLALQYVALNVAIGGGADLGEPVEVAVGE